MKGWRGWVDRDGWMMERDGGEEISRRPGWEGKEGGVWGSGVFLGVGWKERGGVYDVGVRKERVSRSEVAMKNRFDINMII